MPPTGGDGSHSPPAWPDDAEQVLRAIRAGEVDAFVVRGPLGEQIYTLTSAVESYRIILEGIQEGVVTIGLDGTIAFAGRRLATMLGLPLADLAGRRLEEFVVARGRGDFARFLARAANGEAKAEFEMTAADGRILPVFLAARPFDADGAASLCVIVTDLSEQQIQERLRASEERFRLAAQASRDVIWEWDMAPQGMIWADPAHDVFGQSRGAHSADWWAEQIHPDDVARVRREVQAALDGRAERWESEYRLRRNDGSYAHVLNRALLDRDAQGRPRRLIGVLSDVTRDRQALSDLTFLAELGAQLVGTRARDEVTSTVRHQLLAFLPVDGCEIRVGEAGAPANGAAPEGLRLAQRIERMAQEDLAAGRSFVRAEVAPDRSGCTSLAGVGSCVCVPCMADARWVATLVVWRARPHAWEPRELILLQAVADRACVALANAALNDEITRSSRQKDDFLATLSHELRNPLNPLKVAAELLGGAGAEDLPEITGIIERQVDQLGRLLDDLLDMARITRGRVELRRVPLALRDVVDRALESVRPVIEAKAQPLDVSVPEQDLHIFADPVRMVQILSNLLDNASKYSPRGSRIRLVARREGGEAVLCVQDEGRGIDPETLPRVFELFVREDRALAETGGLGIGLHLVKQLVDLHGGSVHASSPGVGRGSEFIVRLPLLDAPCEGVGDPAARPARSRKGCRVLVADDHRDAATTLCLWLRGRGHEVRIAHDGRAALKLAATFAPDVVVLDLGMPGLDGFETARALRAAAITARSLLVAVTGYTDAEAHRRTAEAGFDHHLSKPVDLARLEDILHGILERRADRAHEGIGIGAGDEP